MLNRIDAFIWTIMSSGKHRVYRHLILMGVVLLISMNVFWDEPTVFLPHRVWSALVYFLLLCVLIYSNMYGLVPKVLMRGRSRLYLGFVSLIILAVLLGVGLLQQGETANRIATPPLIGLLSGFFALGLFIVGLTTLQLIKYRMQDATRIADLKKVTMRIELAQLQDQINPHFLFNVLNNANILASENSRQSRDMLLNLADLLHYQIREGQGDWVRLSEDIAFLEDYLALEKTRRDSFRYSIHSAGDMEMRIPPLLFIPFVENAVKHNINENGSVDLSFLSEGGKLLFSCRNPVASSSQSGDSGGLGLANVKRRLDLLFGAHYQLQITSNEKYFEIKLAIQKWTVS